MFTVGESTSRPFLTDVLVNGKRIHMEIDTGAAVSIISEDQQKLLLLDAIIEESPIKLKMYTGENMPVVGKVNANVKCGQQSKNLELIVVMGKGPSLLGRNWLEQLRLDWAKIGRIAAKKVPLELPSLLSKQVPVFKDELGTFLPLKPSYAFVPT